MIDINYKSKNPMQRDKEILEEYTCQLEDKDSGDPICFFYLWDEVSVTLGKIQSEREQIIKEAEALKIPYYIRPTGGKAVLHGADICYTFIASQKDGNFGGTLKESFCKVNKYIIDLANNVFNLGDHSNRGIGLCEANSLYKKRIAANCFETVVANEGVLPTLLQKHKLIGASQAMYKNSFIQQGSLQVNNLDLEWQLFNKTPTLSNLVNDSKPYDLENACEKLNKLASQRLIKF